MKDTFRKSFYPFLLYISVETFVVTFVKSLDMRLSKTKIKKLADKLGVNLDVVSLDTLKMGVKIEMEHGLIMSKTNVTDDDLMKTLKIALAHLDEFPDYYERLLKMEKKAEKYWKNKKKPSIWK